MNNESTSHGSTQGTTSVPPIPPGTLHEPQYATQPATERTVERDAIGLLTEDHRRSELLFSRFAQLRLGDSVDAKFAVARQVCGDLLIHMAIEEAIFYTKARQVLANDALIDAAEHGHDDAKELIKELGDIHPAEPAFDLKMEALAERIVEHVEQEETVVFPKMLVAAVDLVALGQELVTAKSDMRKQLGLRCK